MPCTTTTELFLQVVQLKLITRVKWPIFVGNQCHDPIEAQSYYPITSSLLLCLPLWFTAEAQLMRGDQSIFFFLGGKQQ